LTLESSKREKSKSSKKESSNPSKKQKSSQSEKAPVIIVDDVIDGEPGM